MRKEALVTHRNSLLHRTLRTTPTHDVNLPRGNVNLRRMKYSVLQAPDDGTEMQRKPRLLHRGFKSLMLEV
jgi:hypothetical protein